MRGSAGVLGFVACLSAAGVAGANMAAMTRLPGAVDGPVLLEATAVEVEGETLRFECDASGSRVTCGFEARYRLVNPTGEAQALVGIFYGVRAVEVSLRAGGTDIAREPSAAEVEALDGRVVAVVGDDDLLRAGDERAGDVVTRHGFEITVEGGATAEIVVSGSVEVGARFVPSGWTSPVVTRHLLLGTEAPDPEVFDLEYLLAPIETWAAVGPVEVEVSYPSSWEMRGEAVDAAGYHRFPGPDDGGWEREVVGDRTEARRVYQPEAGDRPAVLLVELRPDYVAPPLYHGGPLLGFGGGVTDGERGFQMRFAYEIAAPDWLFYQVAVDTDFTDRVTVAAVVEAMSPLPYIPLMPSFYGGVGLPVQVLPEVRVGIRLQTGFGWGPASFVASLDFYPGLDTGDAEFFQALLLGVISL